MQRWPGWGTRKYSCMPHISEKCKRMAEEAKLRPTDVVIITFPKTGTTWMQQVCEQMRTGGDMSFTEITERQPWLDFCWDCGQDIDADQVASPRIFKSHQLLSAINVGAKYVSVIRDPKAVLLSWFAFQKAKGRAITDNCADANDYARTGHFESDQIFGTNVWDYYVELWEARNEPNVLVLSYEALVKNQRLYMPRIAEFLGVAADEALLNTVEAMCTKEFMAKHETQFDDNFIVRKQKEFGRCNRVLESASKVTAGHKDVLDAETFAWLEKNWSEKVALRTGFATYDEMAKAFMSQV